MGLSQLSSTVRTIRSDTTLREAAHIMARDSLGTLIISDSAGDSVDGILTDRDIVKEIGDGRDPERSSVAEFAKRPVTTMTVGSSRAEILKKMKTHGIRRVPLVDGSGRVSGLVSLDDVLVEMGEEMSEIRQTINVEFQNEAPMPDPDA